MFYAFEGDFVRCFNHPLTNLLSCGTCCFGAPNWTWIGEERIASKEEKLWHCSKDAHVSSFGLVVSLVCVSFVVFVLFFPVSLLPRGS